MNKTTQRNLAKAYGDDTKNWVGKKVQIQIAKQNVRGEMKDVLYGSVPNALPKEEMQTKITEQQALEKMNSLGLSEEAKKERLKTLKDMGLLE